MQNLNQTILHSVPVPLCSLKEQKQVIQQIESRFSAIDRLEQDAVEALAKLEPLRQSILKRAFSGKLVAQDPKDEPASVLLERIKAEKNENQKRKKKVA